MESKLITVIIPVYNIEPYIDDCLRSVVNQTYRNLEILVVNDGSTDSSESIICQWSKRDSRIKLISQVNSGVSAARNKALDIAKGEYVAFVDGDDWLMPNCISMLYDCIKYEKADVVKCGFKFFNPETGRQRIYSSKQRTLSNDKALKEFFSGKGISSSVCGGIYKSSFFSSKNLRFTPGVTIGEDAQITIQLFLQGSKIALISDVGYIIRVRTHSASRSNILISQEFSIMDDIELPETVEEKYKSAYILRGITSLLLKNAFNYSKKIFLEVYSQLNFAQYNTSQNRSVLATKWWLLANIGRLRFGLFYLAKTISLLGFRPEF